MRAVIFAGPSLPPSARPDDARFDWRPPARQGDVYRAALEGPDAIGLIDGYFDAVPSVWHKEILWAMAQGIRVYGAASIGALRAAELADFGMIGVGRIFEMYRDGELIDDDEVALLHGPAEMDYVPVTVPMVNVRATVDVAWMNDVIDKFQSYTLIGTGRQLYYKNRTWGTIVDLAAVSATSRARFATWLKNGHVNRKLADALLLVSLIATDIEDQPNPVNPARDLGSLGSGKSDVA